MAPELRSHALQLRPRQQYQDKHYKIATVDYSPVLRYGVGVCLGITAFKWLKHNVRKVPVVGPLIAGVMPAVILGAVTGASIVYGLDQGDIFAVKHAVLPSASRRAEMEANNRLAEAQKTAHQLHTMHKLHNHANSRVQRQVEDARRSSVQHAREAAEEPTLTIWEELEEVWEAVNEDQRSRPQQRAQTRQRARNGQQMVDTAGAGFQQILDAVENEVQQMFDAAEGMVAKVKAAVMS